jgi:tetratricopeptide (TPR) repeat protein
VQYYDEYGLVNNAIALCNKILRNAPGRTPVYLRLAKLMVRRGFVAEAKQNLLEYAERMQRAGEVEDAFNALKEFADLSPDNEEIRLLLAEQLKAAARTDEAREQLAKLYHELESRGDRKGARTTLERMRLIDPEYDPAAAPRPEKKEKLKTHDLIFLDLGDEPRKSAAAAVVEPPPPPPAPEPEPIITGAFEEPAGEAPPTEPLEIEHTATAEEEPAQPEVPEGELEIERTSAEVALPDVDAISDLEVGSAFQAPDDGVVSALDIEPTTLDEPEAPAPPEFEADTAAAATPADEADLPLILPQDVDPDATLPGVVDEPIVVDEPAVEEAAAGVAQQAEPDIVVPEPDLGISAEDLTAFMPPDEPMLPEVKGTAGLEVPELDIGGFGEEEPEAELPEPPSPTTDPFGGRMIRTIDLDSFDTPAGTTTAEPEAEPAELPVPEPAPEELPLAGLKTGVTPKLDVTALEYQVADDPDNPVLHRMLGEALLEQGDRERGLEELDIAQDIYEASEDWSHAEDLSREILRLDPNSVRHQQKLVEFAFRRGDKEGLADAYLGLADALFRTGAADRARAVYQRVLEHDPENERARLGLQTLEPTEEEPPAPEAPREPALAPTAVADSPPQAPPPAEPAPPRGDFIDLGSLVLEQDMAPAKDTRMRIEEEEPTGDEQRDFDEMLSQFKKGIEQNVDEEDWQAHYDLGIAFKEMGLLDEAIGEFQKALRSAEGRLRAAEALGLCFFEKQQYSVAATVLKGAVDSGSGGDEGKVGLLYWLARCEEEVGRGQEALGHYQRVFAVDIQFKDVGDRVRALAGAGS